MMSYRQHASMSNKHCSLKTTVDKLSKSLPFTTYYACFEKRMMLFEAKAYYKGVLFVMSSFRNHAFVEHGSKVYKTERGFIISNYNSNYKYCTSYCTSYYCSKHILATKTIYIFSVIIWTPSVQIKIFPNNRLSN